MTDVGTLDDSTLTKFSHVKPGDTGWNTGGLRDFFMYRDLGVAAATHGRVLTQLVRANLAPPSTGTGWHRHDAKFHIVIMLKGWARFPVHVQRQAHAACIPSRQVGRECARC